MGQKMEALELLMYRMKLNITDEREVAMAGPGIYSEYPYDQNQWDCLHSVLVINTTLPQPKQATNTVDKTILKSKLLLERW